MIHCPGCPGYLDADHGWDECPGCGHEETIDRLQKEVQQRLDEQNFLQHRLNEAIAERDALEKAVGNLRDTLATVEVERDALRSELASLKQNTP